MQVTPGSIVTDAILNHRLQQVEELVPRKMDKVRGYFGYNYDRRVEHQGRFAKEGQQPVYNNDIQRQHDTLHRPYTNDSHFMIKDTRNRPAKNIRDAIKQRMSNVPGVVRRVEDSNMHSKQRKYNGPRKSHLWRRPLTNVDTLPYPAEGVEVVYTNDPADAESWLKNNVIDAEAGALGLDIEWRPQFLSKKHGGTENKTAVLQLAVEGSALVLHVFHMNSFPKSLSDVLADRNVLKVGSGIKGDVIKIIKDTGMLCDGRVDTQDYAKALGITQGTGLKRLSKTILDIDLNKPKRVSLSNWEAFPLRRDQITYAALDAWISFKLYIKLKDQLAKKNEGHSEPQVIQIGVDEPEIPVKKSHTCQGCNETLPTKGKLFRHEIRCVLLKQARNKLMPTRNNPNNMMPNQQLNPDQSGNLLGGCSLDANINAGASTSGYSSSSVPSAEHPEADVVVCPVSECRMKCQGREGFREHIQIARHACCEKCGKVFRTKVSRYHRKLHYSQMTE